MLFPLPPLWRKMRRYRSSSSSRTPPGNFHPKPSVAGFLPAKNYSYSYYQKTTIQTTTRTVKNSCSVVGRPRPRPLLPRETPFARFSTRKKRTTTTMISIATPSADGADAEEDEERMQWWWYYHSSRRAFLRVVLTEYRYAYVSVFAAERERERERGTFARESCDDEKDRLKRSTTLLSLNIRAKAYERRTRYDVFSPRIVRCSLLLDSLLNSVLILLLQTLASMIGL